jgi:glycosyltransferase involved in cell wall biosynthesis
MRTLFIVHGYPPQHRDGAEQRAERTARGLVARGHAAEVVCAETASASHADLRATEAWQDGVLIHRLSFDLGSMPDPFRWGYDNLQIGAYVADLIAQRRPDVVHMFGGYLMSASSLRAATECGVPTVVSLTDYWWLCHRINLLKSDGTRCEGPTLAGCARCHAEMLRRYRLPARMLPPAADAFWHVADALPSVGRHLGLPQQQARAELLMKTLQQADVLIAPSRYLADFYTRYGVDPQRIRVWRQGVKIDHCLLRQPSETLRIAYIGQVKPHKGVHTLLDAWQRVRGPRKRVLRLYGSAAGYPRYDRRIRDMVSRFDDVEWVGHFSSNTINQVLSSIDAIVVPSRWVENSPNAILEAQAVGIPVIGSNLGGVAELVEHERNGLIFTPDDPEDLARQLQRLLDEPDLLPHLRRRPIPFRTVDDEIDQLVGLYAELDSAATPAPADTLFAPVGEV